MSALRSILLSSLAAASAASAADSTQELRAALQARGDFNGDGRPDLAVVERSSGQIRVAQTSASGALVWGDTHHSGIAPASGVASGRLLDPARDSLAITGTWANRTNVFDLTNLASLPVPVSVFSPSIGPTGVAAADVLGGDASRQELVLCHTENGSPPQARAWIRFSGSPVAPAAFSPGGSSPPVPSLELRPRRLEGLAIPTMGSFTGTSPTESFRLLQVGATPVAVVAELASLPAGGQFVHADFDGAASTSPAQFVFYQRDDTTLRWCSLSAANSFSAVSSVTVAWPVEQVTALPKSGGGWGLLVAFAAGGAQWFDFNGQSAPQPGESFSAAADGGIFQGAFASGPGDFHLLAGPAGLPATRADRFTWNGTSHAPNGSSTLPALRSRRPVANVFAFTKDPFIATDAVLLGSFSAGDWTRENTPAVPGLINVQQARFANSTDGLGAFQPVTLGPAPVGTNHVMTNQVFPYASAFGPTPALGLTIGEVKIEPPPGRTSRSVRPRFDAPPGVSVFWRIGNGGWIANSSQPPGWQFKDFTIHWYGRGAGGVTTPVYQGVYTFTEGPDTLDSDGDGVPDHVEIAYGLDPVSSGDDGDGDGASDLLELLSGTDPADDSSSPVRTGVVAPGTPQFAGNYQNTFRFEITPLPIAGSTRYATLGAEAARVGLHEPSGLQLGEANTGGPNPQKASLENIEAAYAGSMLVAGMDPVFDLTAAEPDKRRGRELVGLIPVPKLDLGPVPHNYGGGAPLAEANAWILAARAHYAQSQPAIPHTLDAASTLRLLLVELKLEEILRARGELGPAQSLSLTPFRPTETTLPLAERAAAAADAVFHINASETDSLRRYLGNPPAFTYTSGWRVGDIHDAIGSALASPPDAATARLLELAREIHFLSAAASDATLPQFPAPVDTLRSFLRSARLPGDTNADGVLDPDETLSYWRNSTLSPAQIAEAHSAIAGLLALPPSRPTTSGVFVVDNATFSGPVPIVREINTLAPHMLLQGNGEPWPLAQFAPLTPGAELTVTGFSDVTSPHAPSAIEVISLSLTKLPAKTTADSNNNLLGDDWEELFPQLGGNPYADSDSDGFSDLQEYFDGTDPGDPLSIGPNSPAPLGPPALVISNAAAPGTFRIEFQYPPAYAGKINFLLQQSINLAAGFADTGASATHLGGGSFQINVATAAAPSKFWRIRLGLK
jgi:hypothetical protein